MYNCTGIAEATNAVALKARSAAVADTYANQGSRSGAILPFTSGEIYEFTLLLLVGIIFSCITMIVTDEAV